jgi:hypothetical protein
MFSGRNRLIVTIGEIQRVNCANGLQEENASFVVIIGCWSISPILMAGIPA